MDMVDSIFETTAKIIISYHIVLPIVIILIKLFILIKLDKNICSLDAFLNRFGLEMTFVSIAIFFGALFNPNSNFMLKYSHSVLLAIIIFLLNVIVFGVIGYISAKAYQQIICKINQKGKRERWILFQLPFGFTALLISYASWW